MARLVPLGLPMRLSCGVARRSVLRLAGVMFPYTAAGCVLAHPAPRAAGSPPANLSARAVEFASQSGSTIHAWLMPGREGAGAVLLLHGMGGSRRSMLGRALFLHAAGYTIL